MYQSETLGSQFIGAYLKKLQEENPGKVVCVSDPDNYQFAVLPKEEDAEFPFEISIHQLDAGEYGVKATNCDELIGMMSSEDYYFSSKDDVLQECSEQLGSDYVAENYSESELSSNATLLTIAMVSAEIKNETETMFTLPQGLAIEYVTPQTILLGGTFHLVSSKDDELPQVIHMKDFPDAINTALAKTKNGTLSDTLTVLIEIVSKTHSLSVIQISGIELDKLVIPKEQVGTSELLSSLS